MEVSAGNHINRSSHRVFARRRRLKYPCIVRATVPFKIPDINPDKFPWNRHRYLR